MILCVLSAATTLESAELLEMQREHEDVLYRLQLHARLEASAGQVECIFTDYDELDRNDTFLKESRVEY